MIKPSQFTQQMIDLQKTSFLSLYKAATSVQKQASSAMDLMLNQLPWIPSEGRQVISDWLGSCQQEGARFKTYVEKSFANLGMYFSPEAVAKTAKPAKPSAAKVKKASTAEPKKAAAEPTKKVVAEPAQKAAAEPAQKAVAEPAQKADPTMTKKTEPVETKPAKTITAKKADVLKKESKTVLK